MYQFRTTTGATCCSGPSIRNFCDNCKAQAARMPAPTAASAPARALAQTVAAPPNLVDAIREKRGAQPSQRLAAHFNTPRPVTATAASTANTGSVCAAPSLIAAIKENRS